MALRTLQIVSDVHLEFHSEKTIPVILQHGTDLALVGDIGKPFSDIYKKFIHTQSQQFQNVFVIMGNHEYYSSKHVTQSILQKARNVCSQFPNVKLLERESFDISPNTTIIGCTLWSLANTHTSRSLNDFSKILAPMHWA